MTPVYVVLCFAVGLILAEVLGQTLDAIARRRRLRAWDRKYRRTPS